MTSAIELSPEPPSIVSFRDAVLVNRATEGIADRLCALGYPLTLTKGSALAANGEDDQLIYVADGAAKLVARSATDQTQVLAFHFAGDVISVLDKTARRTCGSS